MHGALWVLLKRNRNALKYRVFWADNILATATVTAKNLVLENGPGVGAIEPKCSLKLPIWSSLFQVPPSLLRAGVGHADHTKRLSKDLKPDRLALMRGVQAVVSEQP